MRRKATCNHGPVGRPALGRKNQKLELGGTLAAHTTYFNPLLQRHFGVAALPTP